MSEGLQANEACLQLPFQLPTWAALSFERLIKFGIFHQHKLDMLIA